MRQDTVDGTLVLHCDMNGLRCGAVVTPELKNRPVAVRQPERQKGIVLANELAKKCGVKTAETIWSR